MYGGNLVVVYDRSIYPCCSQMVFETGLSIGNFENIIILNWNRKDTIYLFLIILSIISAIIIIVYLDDILGRKCLFI